MFNRPWFIQGVGAMTWGPYAVSKLATDRNKRIIGRVINDPSQVANAHFMTDTVRNLLFDGHKSDFMDAAASLIQTAINNNVPIPMNLMQQEDKTFKFALYPVSHQRNLFRVHWKEGHRPIPELRNLAGQPNIFRPLGNRKQQRVQQSSRDGRERFQAVCREGRPI